MKKISDYSRTRKAALRCLPLLAICFLLGPLQMTAQTGPRSFYQFLSYRMRGIQANYAFSPFYPTVGQAVQFTDTSRNGPTSWLWDFGDGTTSTAQNPSHAFAATGFHRVSLTASNLAGSANKIRTITVMPSGFAASFTYSPKPPQTGTAIQFTDTSTGSPTSWKWHFGDGTISTTRNPSHTYGAAASYTVTLDATASSGTKTASQTVTVVPSSTLSASFTFNPASPAVGQAVQFTDASSGPPTSWQWNFGDGSSSTAQNPSHTYTAAAAYTVTLTVADGSGSQSTNRSVTVVPALAASFAFSPASPTTGQAVQFTDMSTGTPTSWQWNFGDGGTSTSQNPSHAYATAGTKTVTLTVGNASGSNTGTRTLSVVTALAASFTYSPASPATGQAVQFTDTSTGAPTSWQWNFGDGGTSASQNPAHAFTTTGTKTVTLTVSNASASNTGTRTVSVVAGLTASFTYSPASPATGQAVQFTDTSTGGPTSWQWNFGDGGTSTVQNPSHAFATTGSYTVALIATNNSGSQSVNRTVTVVPALTASFSFSPASPAAGQAVQFTDTSTGTPTSWQWNFGDGTSSTVQNPSHTFAAAGSYTVTLIATNTSGSQSVSRTVTVVPALTASFTYSPASPTTGQAMQFTDTSTGSPTSWQWDFGDGTSSTAQNPSHAYSAAGSYQVTLTIRAGSNLNNTSRTVTIAQPLTASFTYSPAAPTTGQAVQFTDTSTGGPTSRQWNFGDGGTSTSQNPNHTYTTTASYTVSLTVTNSSGSKSISQTVNVSPGSTLNASFTYSPASPASGQPVQFTDTSTGTPTSWQWNFGDGGTSTSQNPSHTFAAESSYTVTLTVSNASGSKSVSYTVTTTSPPPPGTDYDWLLVDRADRVIDWSRVGVWYNGVKGIPDFPIGVTVTGLDPNGVTDGTSIIQAAINSCPSGKAVKLPSGTFKFSTLSMKSNCVLRGNGPTLTKLVSTANGEAITLYGSLTSGPATNLVTGYTKGSDTFDVASASSFSVGDLVLIDQLNDPDFVNSTGSEGVCSWCSRDNGTRTLSETARIIGKSGNTVSISHPLSYSYKASLTPQMYRQASSTIIYAGVEDLEITAASSSQTENSGVSLLGAYGCWAKNVNFNAIPKKSLWVQVSTGCEFRRCYFHDSGNYDSDHGYAVSVQAWSTYNLIEDNVFKEMHANIAFGSGGSGANVAGYNYAYNARHYQADWFIHNFATHGSHTYMNLWEGNFIPKLGFDNIWGSGSHQLMLRNNIRGDCPGVPVTVNLAAIQIAAHQYYDSLIGNVLGFPGYVGTEEYVSDGAYHLWEIGYPGLPPDPNVDTKVAATLLRHGNYDYVTLTTKWNAAITSHDIPNSLYYNSKPSWFGSLDWPAIGSDVSGYIKSTPAKWRWDKYKVSGNIADLFVDTPQ